MADGASGDGQLDNANMFPLASLPGNLDGTLWPLDGTYTP
jgi:hypothetical protein